MTMKNNRYSTHNRHGRDNYAARSRNMDKRDHFDRNFDSRGEKIPFYDDEYEDRSRIRVRSPGRGEMRGRFYDDHRDFDLDVSRRSMRDYSERRYLDGDDVRRGSMEYGREGRVHCDDNGRNGRVVRSSMERDELGRHVTETGNLRSDTEKLGYFHRQNQLLLEKRNGALRDRRDHDELERVSSKYVEDDLFSLKDSNFFSSLARSEDYASASSAISRKILPGSSNARERESDYLASESVYLDEYSEKRQYVSPRRYGDQINDTRPYVSPRRHGYQIDEPRSRSRSYLGHHEEKRVDHFYAGKSKIERGVEEYREQHTSRMRVLDNIVEPYDGKHRGDVDGLWHPRSSSRGWPASYDGHGSMRHQDNHADVDGGRVSHHDRCDVLRTRGYKPPLVKLYDSPGKRGEPSESERRLVDEHFRDEKFARHDSITKEKVVPNSSCQNFVSLPRKQKSSKHDYEKERRMPHPVKFGSGNINRRLGPVPRKRNLSQRVVQKYKKRLRPALIKT